MNSPADDIFLLDAVALRRACNRAAHTFDAAAALHAEVRRRLLERLEYVRLEPSVIVDLGAATGRACLELERRYPQATVIALDFAENMLIKAREPAAGKGTLPAVCADAAALPFADASVDLVFCNLMLHCCNEPVRVFEECRRVLKPQGLLSLATFGPDTLYEMRAAWAEVDRASHVSRFPDMHNVGDAMLQAGLAEPVLDTEYFTLTYKTVSGMMRELKEMGAQNATQGRPRGLCGRTRMEKVAEAYERHREDDCLPATFEVVYGQAWGRTATPTGRAAGTEARVPVSMIGRRTRTRE